MLDPARGDVPSKLYYRIGEVAELVGVEPHVLRYWEREFRTIRPTKSPKGQRVYSRRDVENLLRVRQLLYGEGFTIAGAKKQLKQPDAIHASGPESPPPSEPPEFPWPRAQPLAFAAPESGAVPLPGRAREQLVAMRADIDAFLSELGSRRS
jgi:DNA-binding transcriptional MerR regulator